MNKEFKQTLRFVVLIATPLCFVNSLIFSGSYVDFVNRFLLTYLITFPQAVLYVSIVKYLDKRNRF